MKKVILMFPDIVRLKQFLLIHKLPKAVVDSNNYSVTASLAEGEVQIACREYRALAKA
jgi:hypothetical protein